MGALHIPFVGFLASSGSGGFAHWRALPGAVVISGVGLSFSGTAGQFGWTCSNIGKSTGKWYWEHAISAKAVGNDLEITGISNFIPTTSSSANPVGQNSGTDGFRGHAGWCMSLDMAGGGYVIGSGSCSAGGVVAGDVLGFALDLSTGPTARLDVYVNGVLAYTRVGTDFPLGATYYAACGSDGGSPINHGITNFGASSFAYAVPVGYNPGLF